MSKASIDIPGRQEQAFFGGKGSYLDATNSRSTPFTTTTSYMENDVGNLKATRIQTKKKKHGSWFAEMSVSPSAFLEGRCADHRLL